MAPLVSIIMPCFNSSSYIEEAINSVIKQSYQNWELIIIDDKSTDNSIQIVKHLSSFEPRIKLLTTHENIGGAGARNYGIEQAKGKYIAFLDSDDLWLANKLQVHIEFIQKHKVGFTYSNYIQFINNAEKSVEIKAPMKVNYSNMIKANFIGCLTVVYDVDVYGKFFFPIVKKRHDFALWLKMLKQFKYAYNVNQVLARYRVHNNSLSSSKGDLFQSSFYVLNSLERISTIKSFYYTLTFGILSKMKKTTPYAYRALVKIYSPSIKF